MLPRSFYFLRHGETDWNKQQRIQGYTDIPLNDNGRQQAEAAIPFLSSLKIDRLIVSPLSRAHETATIVNAVLGKPIIIDEGLKERNFGILEGKEINEMQAIRQAMIDQGLPHEENGYPCPPEAEPYSVFKDRTVQALARHLDTHEGENLLFVAHGGIYRVLLRCLMNDIGQSGNAEPFHFEKKGADWSLICLR